MVAGLLIALHISYSKPRVYENKPIIGANMDMPEEKFTRTHVLAFVAIVVAFAAQLMTGSLPLGALAAIIVMILTRTIPWKDIDSTFMGGLEIMGLIAFIMLIAAGYGNVLRETKAVDELVSSVVGIVGGSRFWGAFLMLAVGLSLRSASGHLSGRSPSLPRYTARSRHSSASPLALQPVSSRPPRRWGMPALPPPIRPLAPPRD